MKQIHVSVNPNLEFVNSILLTGRYNEITTPYIGYGLMTAQVNEYTEAIKSFFEKYRQNPVYSYIEDMIPNGFIFSRPVELALSLGNSKDFSMQYPLSDLCIKYCGGIEKICELLQLLKNLENETGYFEFFNNIKGYYDSFIAKARLVTEQLPYIPLLEEIYGKEQNSYHYVISSLMSGNFGTDFAGRSKNTRDIFCVFSTESWGISAPLLLHELSHPFINPLTEKYADIVEEYRFAYDKLKPYKLPNFLSGYGNWQECVDEHFVRAMVIYLLRKCGLAHDAEQMLRHDLLAVINTYPLFLNGTAFTNKIATVIRALKRSILLCCMYFRRKSDERCMRNCRQQNRKRRNRQLQSSFT